MLTAETRIRVRKPLPLPRKRELTGDTKIRLSQIKGLREWIEDQKYEIGQISTRTGLLKTAEGWVVPPHNRESKATTKTLSQRQQRDLERFAKHVDLPGIKPETAQVVIDTMQKQWDKYKYLKNLKEIVPTQKGKPSSGNFMSLELDIETVNNTEKIIEKENKRMTNAAAQYDRVERYLKSPNPQKKEEYEALLEKLKRLRDTKTYVMFPGHETECQILHEIGHIIADQRIGMINRQYANQNYKAEGSNKLFQLCKMVFTTYLIAKKNNDLDRLSFYAARNRHEFFAEAFVMYNFAPDKMPEYIRDMVEAVIK